MRPIVLFALSILFTCPGLFFSATACSSEAVNPLGSNLSLMPYPQKVELQYSSLVLDKQFTVVLQTKPTKILKAEIERFLTRVNAQTSLGVETRVKYRKRLPSLPASPYLNISFEHAAKNAHTLIDNERYQLTVSASHIDLRAENAVGVIRGLETLLQLIGTTGEPSIPTLTVDDFPRFKWRGVLLDSSRHFLSVDTIKRQLDAMAAAKFNVFHWHLTDDQGWRLESKVFPKLHRFGSDGEFYTQKQIRSIVAYAQQRGIHVLPEIDMPGHASAIARAYPELMSGMGPYAAEIRWGVHKPLLNPTDKKVYEFADKLFGEVSDLFPFEYVHIGGDEVDPERWERNASIQAFMKRHNIKDHHALQAWFNSKLVKILAKHDRKMIGWDEIQHPDLPKDIVIQSWRGPDAVSDAVNHGFQALLSTGFYLDQPQPAAYHYRNDPIPSADIIDDQLHPQETWQTWSFDIPRKRGSAVKGSFTIIKNDQGQQRGFIDFSGKSRRALNNLKTLHGVTSFTLDTWMGSFSPRITFDETTLKGVVVVGNAPYPINGRLIAGSTIAETSPPSAFAVSPLDDNASELILGGEAALWSELVDDTVIDLRLWPRAFVVAERLWSSASLRDENFMYARMYAIEDWAEVSINLQHKQQATIGLKKLAANSKKIAPLQVLAQAVEQAQYYHRHHEKHVHGTYSKADLLNLFADTLPAESRVVRDLDQLVDQWLSNKTDASARAAIEKILQSWVNNQKPLLAMIEENQSLKNLQPIAAHVDAVAQLGLQLMDLLASDKTLSMAEVEHARMVVNAAQRIHQEVVVSAAYPVEKLLEAAY